MTFLAVVTAGTGFGGHAAWRWTTGGIGLAISGASLAAMIWPPRLTVAPQGLSERWGWRERRWSWDALCDFRPVRYGGISYVGFDYVPGAGPRSSLRLALARATGADGLLGADSTLGSEALADLLNRSRARWASAEPPRRAASPPPPARVSAWTFLVTFFGGRIDRRAYWAATAAIALVGVVAWTVAPAQGLSWPVIGWMVVARGRLRDLGRSPLWLLLVGPGYVGVVIVQALLQAVVSDDRADAVVAGLAILAATGAVGVWPGDRSENRYGPPPRGLDPAVPDAFT